MDGKFIKKRILNLIDNIAEDSDSIVIENEDESIRVEYCMPNANNEAQEYFHVFDRETSQIFRVNVGNYDTFLDACNATARLWNKIEKDREN